MMSCFPCPIAEGCDKSLFPNPICPAGMGKGCMAGEGINKENMDVTEVAPEVHHDS